MNQAIIGLGSGLRNPYLELAGMARFLSPPPRRILYCLLYCCFFFACAARTSELACMARLPFYCLFQNSLCCF